MDRIILRLLQQLTVLIYLELGVECPSVSASIIINGVFLVAESLLMGNSKCFYALFSLYFMAHECVCL